MAVTQIANLNYQDEAFQDTIQAMLVERLSAVSSGVLAPFSGNVETVGDFTNVPQWATMDMAMEQVVSDTDGTPVALSDYKMRTAWLQREKGYAVEDLVRIVGGKNAYDAVANQTATLFAKAIQTAAINTIKGAFATALATTHSTGAAYSGSDISKEGILAAKQLLGDNQYDLNTLLAHSKNVTDAVKALFTDFQYNNVGGEVFRSGLPGQTLGTRVWADDSFQPVADVYSTYISAPGTLVYGFRPWVRKDESGNDVSSPAFSFEYERNAKRGGGQTTLWIRGSFFVLLYGMQYNSNTKNPSDAQLATGANWTKVADDNKKIKIVELKTA